MDNNIQELAANGDLVASKLPLVVLIFFIVDIILCLAYVSNYWAGQPFTKITVLLDLDSEASFASWYSSIQLFCIFVLYAVFVFHDFNKSRELFVFALLPIVFLLMSIDESFQIHEWIGNRSDVLLSGGTRANTVFQETGIWMFLLGIPFLVFFIVLVFLVRKQFSERPSSVLKLAAGMGILLSGALGVEVLSNFAENGFFIAEVVLEEGLEMLGATVILWSAYEVAVEKIYASFSAPRLE